MLILALDTSGKSISAAVTRDGEIIGDSTFSIGLKHSSTAMPLIHDLCRRCGILYPDIDAYACAVGPGSYTGIRIGISLIKGMAYAGNRPAVGISSLAALAAAVKPFEDNRVIIPLIDAGKGRLFCSVLYQGRTLITEGNRQQADLAEQMSSILQTIQSDSRKILLTGDGAKGYSDLRLWPGASWITDAGPAFRWPRAAIIAALAEAELQTGDEFSPFLLEASYISLSQAERLRQHHA